MSMTTFMRPLVAAILLSTSIPLGCAIGTWDAGTTVVQTPSILVTVERHTGGKPSTRPNYAHPVHISSHALATLLTRLGYTSAGLRGRGEVKTIFAPSSVAPLAAAVADALNRAAPEERVRFEVMARDHEGSIITRARTSTGIVYFSSPERMELRLETVDETQAPEDVLRYSGPSQRMLELVAPPTVRIVGADAKREQQTTPLLLSIDARGVLQSNKVDAPVPKPGAPATPPTTAQGIAAHGAPVVPRQGSGSKGTAVAVTDTPASSGLGLAAAALTSATHLSQLALLDELARAKLIDDAVLSRRRELLLAPLRPRAPLPAGAVVQQRHTVSANAALAEEREVIVFVTPDDARPRVAAIDARGQLVASFDPFPSPTVAGLSLKVTDLTGDGLADVVIEYRWQPDPTRCPGTQRSGLAVLLRSADGYLLATLDDPMRAMSLRDIAPHLRSNTQVVADIQRIDQQNAGISTRCPSSK